MERAIHLSLLWAAFSVLSRMVSVAGSRTTSLTPLPPAPELSLSPPHNIFVPGERVQLACSPPEGWRAEEFWFYKLKPGDQWDLQLRQKEGTWELEVSTAHLEPQTTFVCTYSVGKSAGELLHSAQSNLCPVSILADTVPEPSAAVLAAHTYETDSPGDPARQLTSSQPAAEEKSHSAEADGPVTSAPSSSQSTSHRGISRGRTLTWLWHLVVAGYFFAINGVIFLITLQDW